MKQQKEERISGNFKYKEEKILEEEIFDNIFLTNARGIVTAT